jgi:hypothetical protein
MGVFSTRMRSLSASPAAPQSLALFHRTGDRVGGLCRENTLFAIATLYSAPTAVAPCPVKAASRRRRGPTANLDEARRSAELGNPDRRLNVTRSDNFKPTVLGEIHAAGDRSGYLHFPIHRSGSVIEWRTRTGARSAPGVRREKAARRCKSHAATAPAGSKRSSHGGDELAEGFG